MAVNLSPVGGVAAQFFTNTGAVLTGGKLYTYAAGTTTPVAAYTSSVGSTPWSNPIVLDAAGRVSGSGEIWLTDGVIYKFVLKDSNDVLIATYDNITGINSNFVNYTAEQEIQTATAGQTVFDLATMEYQPGTNSLSVYVDGVNQYGPGAQYAYLETDSNTVTFLDGLHVGASVKFTTATQVSGDATNASVVAYDPPFTGAVSTNVEDKLAQYVSVKDFGAVGDGVADDTAAIQAALNSGATQIYIPQGTYRLVNELTVPLNVSVAGENQRTAILQFENDTNGLKLPTYGDISGVSISQLKIVGNGKALNTNAGIYMDTSNYVRIDRVSIGEFQAGIYMVNSQLNDIHDSTILSCTVGINFDSGSYVNRLYGSTIAACVNGITGSNAIVYAYGCDIEDCSGYAVGEVINFYAYGLHIEGNGTTSVGVELSASINHVYYDTDISSCVAGVKLPGTTFTSGYAKFTNTTFVACTTDIDAQYFGLLDIENPTFYAAGGGGKSPVVNLDADQVVWMENKYRSGYPYLKNLKYGYYGTRSNPNLYQTQTTTGFTVNMGTVAAQDATDVDHVLAFNFDPYLEFPIITFSAYNPPVGVIFEVMMKVGTTDTLIIRATNITSAPIVVGSVTPTIVFANKRS